MEFSKPSCLDNEPATGRLDVLAARIVDRIVTERVKNPVIQQMYPEYRNLIHEQLRVFLGPESVKAAKQSIKRFRTRAGKRAATKRASKRAA